MKLLHIFFPVALLALISADRLRAQPKSTQEAIGSSGATPFVLRTVNFSEVGLIGSPLMLPRWVPGEVTLGSGKHLTTNLLNYDVFERQVTVLLSPRDSVRYQGTVVNELILRPAANRLHLLFRHFADVISDEPALKTELLRVVHQGTYSLVELPHSAVYSGPHKANLWRAGGGE